MKEQIIYWVTKALLASACALMGAVLLDLPTGLSIFRWIGGSAFFALAWLILVIEVKK